MHRLFVALPLPEAIADLLLDVEDGPDSLRWVHADQLHLTLRFIGEVDGAQAEDVAASLAAVAFDAFALRLSGTGCFAHRRHGALWAGVAPRDPVAALAAKIERAVQAAGVAPETRAFHPHITLARWSGPQPPIEPWLTRHAGLVSAEWPVDRFGLYESRLGKAGPSYSLVTNVQAR
ncbi:RNA 2',3'-cyclic phosphodiesterase [Sphingomonas glaciei]|uniref:RNA 2',3'-cyclic phosphodiesterase n=1 Tax=Sphingomonas glaciei TaxID=2938948 RepID=A0ABY5MZC9_9SPHN|nr:RNA 2',3'-cyclic phosphodiesterase [Sphingomonas glaciei]UUR08824.1 RNA 2',3'-cyclic phosphodiesterase [Sphingomonas glaciei]